MMKRIFSLLAVLFLLCVLPVTALAQEAPDLNQNGTITFVMDWDGEPLDSGSLSMYQVGTIREAEGKYSFVLAEKLKDSGVSLADIEDPSVAEELARLAKTEKLARISAPIQDGNAAFSNVVPGLYVVVQAEEDVADGFAPISPFLISMPKYENGQYVYTVTADPKVPLETVPPEATQPPPTKPSDSELPQTGQLNWPVPLMAVAGLILFAAGWLLCFGKKEQYEK